MAKNKVYFFPMLVIAAWWGFAFLSSPTPTVALAPERDSETLHLLSLLSPLERSALHGALAGDAEQMAKLAHAWDVDAQILIENQVNKVQRLSSEKYFRLQKYARLPAKNRGKYLPQTYVSASILLALDSNSLYALPQGLRSQEKLFPPTLTDAIPQDIDPYHLERLSANEVKCAFVAPYSSPLSINALHSRGIPIVNLGHLSTLDDLHRTIHALGHITDNTERAELLSLFIDAAVAAIDNRFALLKHHTVYVNHYLTSSAPTSKTLTGHIVRRAQFNTDIADSRTSWKIPLDNETISRSKPETLIFATTAPEALEERLSHHPFFKHYPRRYVDDTIQQSPSQYIVLAYYDLLKATI